MKGQGRQVLAVKVGGAAAVVEFPDAASLEKIRKEAEQKGAACISISIEEYITTYRGCRYFDLRNSVTRDSFHLDDIIKILAAPLDDHSDEDGNYIFH
ncbi:hypothetical protein UZ36_00100 [Candidatus Nitromaritima sp. SCGC AAA799-C22]|nr:hypothetical protein UZ36_00100 [Candidatus Nitromaritima sp. SCGC AAA799-C22]